MPISTRLFTSNTVNVQRVDEVVGFDATEVVPSLIVSAAEQAGVVHTTAVVDVGQIVADGADVGEVDVLFHNTLATVDQR